MADYVLSHEADQDLIRIYLHTFQTFGEAQAEAYVGALADKLSLLSISPGLGRRIDRLRTGYRRFEHASHAIFYKERSGGILVVRILHAAMDPERHL
jgi:toxin ParE1/3/4